MTVPTNGPVRDEDLRKLLGPKVLPFGGFAVRMDQPRGMVKMLQPAEVLMTKHTALSFIPAGNDIPNQTIVGIGFNLLQTFLSAVLSLWPT